MNIYNFLEKGAMLVKQQSPQIICTYSTEGDIEQILQQSFSLYLDRALADEKRM
jgi:hypothetical protein